MGSGKSGEEQCGRGQVATPDSDVAGVGGGCLWRLGVSGLALGQRVEGNQRAQGVEAEGGKLAFLGSWWWPLDTSVSTWCVASTQRHSGLCEGGGGRCGHDTRASEEQWGGGDGAERLGHVCG